MPRKPPGAEPRKPGPPRLIDAKKRQEIITAVKLTGSRRQAAAFCEVSYDTVYREMKRDPQFAESLTNAVEICKYECVKFLRESGNVKAVTFFMERRWPHEYGRRSADAMTIPEVSSFFNQSVAIMLRHVNKTAAAKILQDLAKIQEEISRGKSDQDAE